MALCHQHKFMPFPNGSSPTTPSSGNKATPPPDALRGVLCLVIMSNVAEPGRVFQVVSVEWELPGEWGRSMDQWPVASGQCDRSRDRGPSPGHLATLSNYCSLQPLICSTACCDVDIIIILAPGPPLITATPSGLPSVQIQIQKLRGHII